MADLAAQLDQQIARMKKHFEDGTMKEGLKNFYAKDCKVMAPGMENHIDGCECEDMNKNWERRVAMGAKSANLTRGELLDLGDTAVERGHYEFTKADKSTAVSGHYVFVWKKVDGEWRVYYSIYTEN